jgi:hypothetical protein
MMADLHDTPVITRCVDMEFFQHNISSVWSMCR